MSEKSNRNGRAYEYSCILALEQEIGKIRPVSVIDNGSLAAVRTFWDALDETRKAIFLKSSHAAVRSLFRLEPRIAEPGDDVLTLEVQKDTKGTDGDVRDIVIRRNIGGRVWEIGLSIKHNHRAAKHSRLSPTIDFGNEWFGHPCSDGYWESVTPVFDLLEEGKQKGMLFSSIPDKSATVYRRVLDAFINELRSLNAQHKDIPGKLVEYILSRYDFYKVISDDPKCITVINPFNIHGTLNRNAGDVRPQILVEEAPLPKRIISIDFKPGSSTTVELYMDKGWQFSFRLHNAERVCVPSLKFDIRIIGLPFQIITVSERWI